MIRHAFTVLMVVSASIGGSPLAAAEQSAIPSSVSSDSAPGWEPFEADQEEALATARAFLDAFDGGRFADAYAMEADEFKASATEAKFAAFAASSNAKSGPLVSRRLTAITWTKHPSSSDNPGTFAAIDMVEKFANIDRACRYLVVVKTDEGMKILRSQTGSIDNAQAQDIVAKRSAEAVNEAWRAIAKNYPNCPV